jgi:hypothetical protein
MSRSFKKQPFMAICGGGSAQYDKTLAARGVRRAHRQTIHNALHIGDYEVVLPHRLQCCHNNTYSWGRDGKQRWCGLDARDWYDYVEANDPDSWMYEWMHEHYGTWPPKHYVEMMRK